MQRINWGIIGCGGIAHLFARGLATVENSHLLAVAGRTPGNAHSFAEKHGAERVYTEYEALVADPEIDAVYIATTHNFHFKNIQLCLENGKHVICEKPFTLNAQQAEALANLAQQKNLFLMEALWTRFLPAINALGQLLADGVIGTVMSVRADFCIDGREFSSDHRLKNKALAGGALLDLGVYCVAFARFVFGAQPQRIQSSVKIGETGVDDHSVVLLDYSDDRTAVLSCGYTHEAPMDALIIGTHGYIRIPRFFGAQELTVHVSGSASETTRYPFAENENFRFEIEEVASCIAAGKIESRRWPLTETVAVLQTMDALRDQWGLVYENE